MNRCPRARRRAAPGSLRLRAVAVCAIAGSFVLLAPGAWAADGRRVRELVPTGARATIYLEPPLSAEDTIRELELEKGKSAFVRTSYDVTRVSVGNPDVADVVVLRQRELQIIGRGVGATNIVLWGGAGEIEAAIDLHVRSPFSEVEAEIRRTVPGSDVRVSSAGESVVLSGYVVNAAMLERVLAVAGAFYPERRREEGGVVNLLEVGGNQQVLIEVTVSEMSRNLRKAIGTNFAATITDGRDTFELFNIIGGLTSPTSLTGPSGEVVGELIEFSDQVNFLGSAFPIGSGVYQLFVNALDETGVGKILAEPTLVARTGKTARFLAGGEVPIPVAQDDDSITIIFKEFGVGLAFTPTVLAEDRIHLEVTTEVSQIDFALGTQSTGVATPGFRTRRASTGVELGDGQMFAIAGLVRDELSEQVSQYPVLGQIPILGTLFRTSTYDKQMSELVIVARPRLVRPLGPEPPPLPTDYFDEPNWFEFYLLGRVEGRDDLVAAAEREAQAGIIGEAGYRLPAVEYEEEAQ